MTLVGATSGPIRGAAPVSGTLRQMSISWPRRAPFSQTGTAKQAARQVAPHSLLVVFQFAQHCRLWLLQAMRIGCKNGHQRLPNSSAKMVTQLTFLASGISVTNLTPTRLSTASTK